MKLYNIKSHYCRKHAAEFNGVKGQLRFDKIEQFKKSLSMQIVFHAYKKDIELVAEPNFKISEVILTVMMNSLRIVWSYSLDEYFQKRNV